MKGRGTEEHGLMEYEYSVQQKGYMYEITE